MVIKYMIIYIILKIKEEMRNLNLENIKKEGCSLIDDGYKPSEVVTMLFLKHKDDFESRRAFETKFGRTFRRYAKKTSDKNAKIIKMTPRVDKTEEKPNSFEKITSEKNFNDGTGVIEYKTVKSDKIPTDEEILEKAGFNPETKKIVSMRKSEWEAQSKDGIITMQSFKINVAPKAPKDVDFYKILEEKCNSKHLKFPSFISPHTDGDECAVVCIPDLHLGKYADPHVCGVGTNTKKAEKAFWQILSQAIDEIKHRNIEKIYFFWSQDFFHFDTPNITTTAGTRQDTDTSYQSLYKLGVDLLTEGIEALAKIAPVETFYIPSNHDEMTGYHAAVTLSVYFKDCPDVTIDLSAEPRHYSLYGVNLMGFAHGDKEGKRIEGMMQFEAPEKWGKSHFREFFMGHFHSLHQYEKNGIIFRYLQSPTGTDAWHKRSGFVGAQKCGQLFIRNKYYGPVLEKQLFVLEDKLDEEIESSEALAKSA